MIKSRFLTTGRDDLFAMTRRLMTAVAAADLPRQAGAPLLIGVAGSLQSGKKIVTDAAVEALFDPGTAVMDGKRGYDEYWRGTRGGMDYAVNYIDMAYPHRMDYSRSLAGLRMSRHGASNDMAMKYKDFLSLRSAPGITFVQNPGAYNAECGISVYVENRAVAQPVGYKIPRLHLAPNSLKSAFANLAAGNDWARLVEIEVRDPRLLASPAFMDDFIAFAPFSRLPDRAPSEGKKWSQRLHRMIFIDQEVEPRGVRAEPHVFGRGGFPHIPEPMAVR